MHIICEVLDNQLVDRNGRKIGRIDGIVLELRDGGAPPRIAYIEIGASTLARRVHPRLGKWVERLGRKWGVRRGRPFRIEWRLVRDVGIDVDVDLEAEGTPLVAWEEWLREKIIARIPGGG